MTQYYQETDSKIVFTLPPEISYPIPVKPQNETVGGSLAVHFIPLPRESSIIKSAWSVIRLVENQVVAQEAKKLLLVIQDIIYNLQQFRFDLSYLPPLYAFLVDDGSVLVEWIFRDYRIGFTVEPMLEESGWYLVSNKKLGEINASGYMSGDNLNNLVLWLLNFALSHP